MWIYVRCKKPKDEWHVNDKKNKSNNINQQLFGTSQLFFRPVGINQLLLKQPFVFWYACFILHVTKHCCFMSMVLPNLFYPLPDDRTSLSVIMLITLRNMFPSLSSIELLILFGKWMFRCLFVPFDLFSSSQIDAYSLFIKSQISNVAVVVNHVSDQYFSTFDWHTNTAIVWILQHVDRLLFLTFLTQY